MRPLKIFIADDHQLVQEGLSSLIRGIEHFTLVGAASTGEELISTLSRAEVLPDICILDIEMPGQGGVATLRILKERFPALKVLILTMHEESFYVNRVIKEGADGYLHKNLNRDSFIESIGKIMKGESFFVQGLDATTPSPAQDTANPDVLTPREKHILRLIALGKSNKEIAKELHISHRTVDTHRNNLMHKLNISSSVLLVHYAYSNNLL
ncbi:response regulator transcription factor [Fulvivirgaceae bacterium PWU4]|uniref:Response regulator transcription factor n=1 Tax=Chryseosolibacter histidini TaxID=2782349 RepID=A0AAP2DLV1_9BACT|nr:response regulator transcription factor [Chryseosolibacter histidini]MBT1698715.1 response regulator transcription factor [Chryseosolibacter histidini]